jgi:Tol biopolymer transport system component
MNADGSGAHLLVAQDQAGQLGWPLRWSPDGRLIAYVRSAPTPAGQNQADIWVVNTRTGQQQSVTQTPLNESAPA